MNSLYTHPEQNQFQITMAKYALLIKTKLGEKNFDVNRTLSFWGPC